MLESNCRCSFNPQIYFKTFPIKKPLWCLFPTRAICQPQTLPRIRCAASRCCEIVVWGCSMWWSPANPFFCLRPHGVLVLRTLVVLVRASLHKKRCVPGYISQQRSKTSSESTHMRTLCQTQEGSEGAVMTERLQRKRQKVKDGSRDLSLNEWLQLQADQALFWQLFSDLLLSFFINCVWYLSTFKILNCGFAKLTSGRHLPAVFLNKTFHSCQTDLSPNGTIYINGYVITNILGAGLSNKLSVGAQCF